VTGGGVGDARWAERSENEGVWVGEVAYLRSCGARGMEVPKAQSGGEFRRRKGLRGEEETERWQGTMRRARGLLPIRRCHRHLMWAVCVSAERNGSGRGRTAMRERTAPCGNSGNRGGLRGLENLCM
jgi:hypothetical protein